MELAIQSFEILAQRRVQLLDKSVSSIDGLVHPIHQRAKVYGWRIEPL